MGLILFCALCVLFLCFLWLFPIPLGKAVTTTPTPAVHTFPLLWETSVGLLRD